MVLAGLSFPGHSQCGADLVSGTYPLWQGPPDATGLLYEGTFSCL